MNKKLYVLGGGFISYNVCKILKDKEDLDIILVARRPHEGLDIPFIKVDDFTEYDSIKNITIDYNGENYVLNCVGTSSNRLAKDTPLIYYNNIETFFNIYKFAMSFASKIFYIGSGAGEEDYTESSKKYYSKSKKTISNFISNIDLTEYTNCAVLQELVIYGSFGENELESRFIKTCFDNAKYGLPIVVNKDIKFDFISMYDFSSILYSMINDCASYSKTYCTYEEKLKLSEIARMINNLYGNKSIIIVNEESNNHYISKYSDYDMYYDVCFGLKESLKKLKEEYYDRKS